MSSRIREATDSKEASKIVLYRAGSLDRAACEMRSNNHRNISWRPLNRRTPAIRPIYGLTPRSLHFLTLPKVSPQLPSSLDHLLHLLHKIYPTNFCQLTARAPASQASLRRYSQGAKEATYLQFSTQEASSPV